MFTLTTLKYFGVISLVTYALAFWAAYPMVIGELSMALLWVVVVGVLDGTDGKLARLSEKKTLIGKLEHSFDMLFIKKGGERSLQLL